MLWERIPDRRDTLLWGACPASYPHCTFAPLGRKGSAMKLRNVRQKFSFTREDGVSCKSRVDGRPSSYDNAGLAKLVKGQEWVKFSAAPYGDMTDSAGNPIVAKESGEAAGSDVASVLYTPPAPPARKKKDDKDGAAAPDGIGAVPATV